jgi:hypothetical protein
MQRALLSRGTTRIDLCETGMAPHMRPMWLQKKHLPHQKSPTVLRYETFWFVWHVSLVSRELKSVVVYCSMLQCVLQCVAVCDHSCKTSPSYHVCCSVLRRVPVCCSVLRNVFWFLRSLHDIIMTHMLHSYLWPNSFIRAPWLIRMWHMTHMTLSHLCPDLFICVPWLYHLCAITQWRVCHDLRDRAAFMCAVPLSYMT